MITLPRLNIGHFEIYFYFKFDFIVIVFMQKHVYFWSIKTLRMEIEYGIAQEISILREFTPSLKINVIPKILCFPNPISQKIEFAGSNPH